MGAVAAALPLLALVFAAAAAAGDAAPTTHVDHRRATARRSPPPTAIEAAANPHEFPDFRIAMDEATDYLDPGLSDTAEGWGVMWNVYLPLIGYKHVSGPDGATLVPYLATSLPHISPNGRDVLASRFARAAATRTAAACKASDFKRDDRARLHARLRGRRASSRNIVGADALREDARRAESAGIRRQRRERTIVIHLVAPQGDFENVLASEFAAPVPANAPHDGHVAPSASRDRPVRDRELSAAGRGSSRCGTRTSRRGASTATFPPATPTA